MLSNELHIEILTKIREILSMRSKQLEFQLESANLQNRIFLAETELRKLKSDFNNLALGYQMNDAYELEEIEKVEDK